MKKTWYTVFALLLALCLCVSACGKDTDGGDESGSGDAAQAALFTELEGTYEPLFPVMCDPAWDSLWIEECAAVVGDDMAADTAQMLKDACTGTVYGDEAVVLYGDGSQGARFDCDFIGGVTRITFSGNEISGTDGAGNVVFSHVYEDAGTFSLGGMMEGELYETKDEDAGEFRYFLIMPDTPATTWHIEFRYGSDTDALAEYNAGPYAYWLAAGIPENADDDVVESVIRLFCQENLAEMSEEEAA